MPYIEELRARICKLTGLRGIEVDHILRALEMQGVDPETIDWETMGHEIIDYANRYEAAWDWLARNYGIAKPPEIALMERVKRGEIMEEEELYGTEEGVREVLRRIYEYPTPEREKKDYKRKLKERSLYLVSSIAAIDGYEQKYAKKFLEEEVVKGPTEEDVLDVLKKGEYTPEEIAGILYASVDEIRDILLGLKAKGRVEETAEGKYRVRIEVKLQELLARKKKLLEERRMAILSMLRERFPELYIHEVKAIDKEISVDARIPSELRYRYRDTELPIHVTGTTFEEIVRKIDEELEERLITRLYEKIKTEEEMREAIRMGLEVRGVGVEKIKTEEESLEELRDSCLRWGTQTSISCPTCSVLARVDPEMVKVVGKLKQWGDVYCCPVCGRLFSLDLSLLWYPPPS